MRRRKGTVKNEPQVVVHAVDGAFVMIVGATALVQKPGVTPMAVHVPTACLALAESSGKA